MTIEVDDNLSYLSNFPLTSHSLLAYSLERDLAR